MPSNPKNAREALEIDTEFYAEYDEETACYGVFGNNSEFCYDLFLSIDQAKTAADQKNKKIC